MSGLDINTEHILEMACIVTDAELNIIAEVGLDHWILYIDFIWNWCALYMYWVALSQ